MTELKNAVQYMLFKFFVVALTAFIFTTDHFLKAHEVEECFFHLAGKGSSLRKDKVIASHRDESWVDCGQRCIDEKSCVGFNFNAHVLINKKRKSCELSDVIERNEKLNTDSDWTYYQKILHLGSYGMPGKSCAHILQETRRENLLNGEYWIKVDTAGPIRVFCDMKTNGGGWTLVYNIALQTSKAFTFSVEKNWQGISNYTTGKVVLTADALGDLKKKMPFQQLRFHCSKKIPGRTFHVVTKKNLHGDNVVKYFTAQNNIFPQSCGSFYPMADDNSVLSPNCSKWKNNEGAWSREADNRDTRLIDHVAFIPSTTHWNIKDLNRWECDDKTNNLPKNLSPGDFWKIFVR